MRDTAPWEDRSCSPMLSDALRKVARDLRSALPSLEPERLSGGDVALLLTLFADIEKLAAGGKLLAARRVESSNVWRREGHRSAAAHVADATGSGLGPAITALEAACQLGSLPARDEAMRDGRRSEAQVKEITSAAILQPAAEQELVDAAESQSLNMLKLRCRRVKANGKGHGDMYESIRRGRYFRHWTEADGAVRFDARLTPDDGARVVAVVDRFTDHLVDQARLASDSILSVLVTKGVDVTRGGPRGTHHSSIPPPRADRARSVVCGPGLRGQGPSGDRPRPAPWVAMAPPAWPIWRDFAGGTATSRPTSGTVWSRPRAVGVGAHRPTLRGEPSDPDRGLDVGPASAIAGRS